MLLPLFVIAHFSHHLVAALLTPLLPYIRESFAIDYTRAGVLLMAFNLAYGVGQLPGGWLADRLGFARLMTAGITGVALCGVLAGLAPGFLVMAVSLALMGVLGGGYHPSASPLISTRVETRYRGRALGIHQVGGTASFFLGPIAAGGIAAALGWRGAFLAVSAPTMAFGVLFFLLLRRWKTEKGEEAAPVPEEQAHWSGRLSALLPIMLLNVLTQVLVFTSLSFVPLYAVDELGAGKEAGAMMLSIAHSAGLWAGPLAGSLSDRMGKVPIILAAGLLAGPMIFLLNHATLQWSIYPVLLMLGMCQYMGMPVTESYVITHAPRRRRSTILGVYYTVSRGGPGLMAPVMGYLIDRYRFSTAYLAAAAAMTAVAAACWVYVGFARAGGGNTTAGR
ncbi:MAG: MFS transporter [Spirochaetota bacterium]